MRIKLTNVRARYLHVFRKKLNTMSGNEEFSLQFFIPKNDTLGNLQKMQGAIDAVIEEQWGMNPPANLQCTFRDGDIKEGKKGVPDSAEAGQEPYGGHYFMSLKSEDKPGVVGPDGMPLAEEDLCDGDWINVSLDLFAATKVGNWVTARLGNVQKVKNGEPMGNKVRAEDEFDSIDEQPKTAANQFG